MENIRCINIELRKYSKLTNLCKKLSYIPFLTIKAKNFLFLLIVNLQIAFILKLLYSALHFLFSV